ncbi:MAG: hypothetical protein HY293_00665 [Planctomycetes bacterium]|nr:hypothetical protein [Planctomycetota bacterium]
MANEIFYCSRCQTRLFGQQFLEGTAYRVRDQISCENCLGEIIAPLSLEEQQEILLQVKALRDSQVIQELPEVAINEEEFFELDTPDAPQAQDDFFELDTPEKRARPRPQVPVTSKTAAAEASQNRAVTVFLLCLFGIVGIGLALYLTSDPERPATPIGEKPVSATSGQMLRTYADRSTAPNPRSDEAKAAFEKAKEFVKANPTDLAGQQEALKKAVDTAEGTPVSPDAHREYEQLIQKQKELIARELEAADKETAAAVEKEDFRTAMEKLQQLKTRYAVGEWRGSVDLRITGLRSTIWKMLFPLRDKAVAAKQSKNDAEVKAITERVAKWGLPEFSRDLENSLGGSGTATAPPPSTDVKPPSAESKAYEVRWRQAMELATQRDFDAALAAVDKSAAGLKEDDVKTTVAADQDILRRIQAVHREALQVIAQWTRNEKIPLEYLDDNLSNERIEDPFIRADAEKIEVARGGAPFAIELSELTARSLANLLRRKKPDSDARSLALFCLVEGDLDSARQNFSGPADQIPYRYWSLATKIAESRSGITEASKREAVARKTYFAAERGYSDMKTRATSVQSYRELLNLYPDTAIVKRRRAQILARRDGAKDYVFLCDDMDAAGTFTKTGKQPKYGECWASNADSDASRGAHNYVNVKFYAFPDVAYQCWAYVGGCCEEVLGGSYQATDLTYTKGSEVMKLEPGGNAALSIRHTISFMKRTHVAHGGPKESKLWEWAELKLPKYTQAGIKDVRITTDQKAFSVVFIVVSASRSSPPNEAEMKSWVKKPDSVVAIPEDRPSAVEAAVVEQRDPALIGHWKLDESGGTAVDASGRDNSGVLVGEPSRVPGKFGGAIAFDGKDRYVSIPNSEVLDRVQEGTFTIACWFKPNSKPGGPNDAAYAVFAKSSSHEGITYNADQKFVLDHVLANNTPATAVTAAAFVPGNYYHVAGVVNRTEGSVRIYVNGKLEGSASFPAGGAAKDFKNETWKIGIALPGGGAQRLSADGIVDDARIYSRALQPGDLKTIAGIAGGTAPSIVITSPIPGEKFDTGATVTLSATATPADRIAKLEFYAGSTMLATKTSPPFTHAWNRVAGGTYLITARATDKSGTAYTSAPLTIRVGNPTLYRALNLGGAAARVDGVDFEGKGAKGISTNGSPIDIKSELTPPPDGAMAPLLKKAVVHPLGTSVSLIGIPNGAYQIFLYVCAEGAPQVYELQLAGRTVQSKIQSGPAGSWQKLGPWTVDSTGGLLEIAAKGGEVNFCALEVWKVAK